jgi:prepilin-type processing-associated H-X9-DG protein
MNMAKSKTKKTLFRIFGGLLFALLFCVLLWPPTCFRLVTLHPKLICGTYIHGLGTALRIYAFDYDDKYPAENWCDLLVMEADVSPKSLLCPASDGVEGESSYALNLAVAEQGGAFSPTNPPANLVLAFETSAGRSGQREILKDGRKFQTVLEDMKVGRVYKNMWNQIGGPELLTLEYHNGEGANFLFNDGHSEFVRPDGLTKLRWNKDDTVRLTEADVQRLVKEAKAVKKPKWRKR